VRFLLEKNTFWNVCSFLHLFAYYLSRRQVGVQTEVSPEKVAESDLGDKVNAVLPLQTSRDDMSSIFLKLYSGIVRFH
jgi:hypothetical protein